MFTPARRSIRCACCGLCRNPLVIRDDAFLASSRGASWFDDTRQAGSSYTYTLIARNAQGTELERIRVEEAPDGINDPVTVVPEFITPILAEWNTLEVVRVAFSVLSGQAFGNELLALPDYNNALYLDPEHILAGPINAVAGVDTCINGGTASIVPLIEDEFNTENGWDFTFENCQNNTETIDGEVNRLLGNELAVGSNGLSVTGQDRNITFSGDMLRLWAAPLGSTDVNRYLVVSSLNWRKTVFDGNFEISNADFTLMLHKIPAWAGVFIQH